MTSSGTPFMAYASLSNASPGPTNFTIFTVMGQAAYTLQSTERLHITSITISSNDSAQPLVTVDTGGTTPTKLASTYPGPSLPPFSEAIPPGVCRGIFGVTPRASAPAITSAKSVEVVLSGFVSRS